MFASLTVMEAAHFFEGTEKLLEVWFSRQQPDANQGSGDLRTIPRWVLGAVAAWKAPATGWGRGPRVPAAFRWGWVRGRGSFRLPWRGGGLGAGGSGRVHAWPEPTSPAAVAGPGAARGEGEEAGAPRAQVTSPAQRAGRRAAPLGVVCGPAPSDFPLRSWRSGPRVGAPWGRAGCLPAGVAQRA